MSLLRGLRRIAGASRTLLSCSANKPQVRCLSRWSATIEHLHPEPKRGLLETRWSDKKERQFPVSWLRDNCQCSQCFSPSADARISTALELETKVTNLALQGKTVVVTWADGHVSTYPFEWLEKHSFMSCSQSEYQHFYRRDRKLWNCGLQNKVPKFDFETIIENELALYEWLCNMETTGIAMLEDVPPGAGQLHRLGERVGFLKVTPFGEVHRLKIEAQPDEFMEINTRIHLHSDFSYGDSKFGAQMLHCLSSPESEGGENILTDGHYVANLLKNNHPREFELLSTLPVYNYFTVGHGEERVAHLMTRKPCIVVNADGQVEQIHLGHHCRDSFQNIPIEDVNDWYQALYTFVKLLYSKENRITHKMKAGEILCTDNSRVLLGRESFKLLEPGERVMDIAYIEGDIMRSKRRVLMEKMGIGFP